MVERCFHFSNAESQKILVAFVTFIGSNRLVVNFVAHTLDKKPDKAISVAKRRPKPPLAIVIILDSTSII